MMWNWLQGQNWKRWIGDAALAAVILFLASIFAGAFDIFTNVENGVQVAGLFGLCVWYGMPFLGKLIPSKFSDYLSIVAEEDAPIGQLMFDLSAPGAILLLWSFLVW